MMTIEERLQEIHARLDMGDETTDAAQLAAQLHIALTQVVEALRAQQQQIEVQQKELAGLHAWLAAHDRNIKTLFSDRV